LPKQTDEVKIGNNLKEKQAQGRRYDHHQLSGGVMVAGAFKRMHVFLKQCSCCGSTP